MPRNARTARGASLVEESKRLRHRVHGLPGPPEDQVVGIGQVGLPARPGGRPDLVLGKRLAEGPQQARGCGIRAEFHTPASGALHRPGQIRRHPEGRGETCPPHPEFPTRDLFTDPQCMVRGPGEDVVHEEYLVEAGFLDHRRQLLHHVRRRTQSKGRAIDVGIGAIDAPERATALGLQVRHPAEREISRVVEQVAGRSPVSGKGGRPSGNPARVSPLPQEVGKVGDLPSSGKMPRQQAQGLFPFPDDAKLYPEKRQHPFREDGEPGPPEDHRGTGLRSQGGNGRPDLLEIGNRGGVGQIIHVPDRHADQFRGASANRSHDICRDILREAEVEQRHVVPVRPGRSGDIRDPQRRHGVRRRCSIHRDEKDPHRCPLMR